MKCPELLPENYDVWALWTFCFTQWRAGGFGIIGLDYPAVFRVAEVLGIEVTEDLLIKLRYLEHKQLEHFRKKGGRE